MRVCSLSIQKSAGNGRVNYESKTRSATLFYISFFSVGLGISGEDCGEEEILELFVNE